jgi:hypothetical protein
MKEVMIIADLSTISIYRIIRDPLKLASDRLEEVKRAVSKEPRTRAADKFSDSAGRFYQGGGMGGTTAGFGEPHNTALEEEKRIVKHLADEITALVAEKDCEGWFLAAGKSINNQVLGQLSPAVKAKLKGNVAANLTKTPKAELLGHFLESAAS